MLSANAPRELLSHSFYQTPLPQNTLGCPLSEHSITVLLAPGKRNAKPFGKSLIEIVNNRKTILTVDASELLFVELVTGN